MDSLHVPFPLLSSLQNQRVSQIPLVFLSSEFQDRKFIHYKGEKDIFFLIHLILWEWEGRQFQPSFYSIQTTNLPSSTSAVKTWDSTQTKAHKVPPGDMKESSKFFSVSPNIQTHTRCLSLSSPPSLPLLSYLSLLPFPFSPSPSFPLSKMLMELSIRCSSCQSARPTGQRAWTHLFQTTSPSTYLRFLSFHFHIVPQPGHWVPAPWSESPNTSLEHSLMPAHPPDTEIVHGDGGRRIVGRINQHHLPDPTLSKKMLLKRPWLWNLSLTFIYNCDNLLQCHKV